MQVESRGALQDVITAKAASDAHYRSKLLADPRGVLSTHLGRELPDWLKVQVVEEKADTLYLIAPHVVGEELADEDVEMVAGGKGGGGTQMRDVKCERNYGAFNSVITIESEVSLV